MKLSYNKDLLKNLSDEELIRMYSDKTRPTISEIEKIIGRKIHVDKKEKVSKSGK